MKKQPVYVCDLCKREGLVYHSAYLQDSSQVWGVGICARGGYDNLPNCTQHLCMYCLEKLGKVVESLERRGYLERV